MSTIIGLSNVAVTRIVAGTNISLSPVGGTGNVTINATGGGSASIPFVSAFTVSTGFIFTSSMAINTPTPGAILDVNGTGRFVTLSSQALFVSSFYTATRTATPMFITF